MGAEWKLLPEHPRADALEVVRQGRHGDRRRVLDQQVHMVCLAVQLQQLEAHLLGNAQAHLPHPIQSRAAQDLAAVLHDKHQMDNEPRNAVSASPKWWLRHCTPSLV